MLDLFQIADVCGGLLPVVKFIRNGIMPIIQIGIPILLILFGSIDLGKAVMSQDDKEIKGATGKLIKRAISAAVVFFIPFIVTLVMNLISTAGDDVGHTSDWAECWKAAEN